jgi:hypothetical protein
MVAGTACKAGATLAKAFDGGALEKKCQDSLVASCPGGIANNDDCNDVLKCAYALLKGDPNTPASPCELAAISIAQTAIALKDVIAPPEERNPAAAAFAVAKAQRCLASVAGQCLSG